MNSTCMSKERGNKKRNRGGIRGVTRYHDSLKRGRIAFESAEESYVRVAKVKMSKKTAEYVPAEYVPADKVYMPQDEDNSGANEWDVDTNFDSVEAAHEHVNVTDAPWDQTSVPAEKTHINITGDDWNDRG